MIIAGAEQVNLRCYNQQAREALNAAMLALKESGNDLRMVNVEVDPVSLT